MALAAFTARTLEGDEWTALRRRVHNDLTRAGRTGQLEQVMEWTAPITYGELHRLLSLLDQLQAEASA